MRRVIVADDLTGASDAGVQFAKRGVPTTVWLDADAAACDEAAVTAIDLNSRAVAPEAAYERMRALLRRIRPRHARDVVKKMDSTLRGNTGAELRALLEALPDAFAIVCPAYPKHRRVARDGVLLVDGTPVDETDFGRDLFAPVRDARIATHLPGTVATFGLELVRRGAAAVAAAIDDTRANGVRIAVADAERDDDLTRLATIDRSRDDIVWVGSAGLVEALAGGVAAPAAPAAVPAAAGAVLMLVGSTSAMTRLQIADAAHDARVHRELLDPVALLEGDDDVTRAIRRAAGAMACGHDVLIALERGARDASDAPATSRVLRERLAAAVDGLARNGATVVLSGGDVARAFCERRGVAGMTLVAELTPGIPIARAVGSGLVLVTKAGGFGEPQTYRRILDALHGQVTA